MKKQFLLTLAALLIFIGGFLSGVAFLSHTIDKEQANKQLKSEQSPISAKQPKQKQLPKVEQANPKVLIGYVQDFRDPYTIDYSGLTHIIFSFAHPAKDGKLLMNGESALSNLRTTVKKAHQLDKKVMLAVGGWYHIEGGESYEYFKTAISNPISRNKLIKELIGIADREKLDGIDIDFEHPRSQEDARNLAIFTNSLSEKLHAKDKELSIAVYSKIHSVTGTEIKSVVFEPTMFNSVDHVNIMAYDGQWDGEYNAANLSPYSFSENIVAYWSELFDKHGISKEKLVLGVPSYAQPKDVSIKQVSYSAILNNDPANANQDHVNMNGTTYYYNGVKTIQKKTNLALDNGFGGMMLWELGHDAKGPKSITNTISEILKKDQTIQKQYVFQNRQR